MGHFAGIFSGQMAASEMEGDCGRGDRKGHYPFPNYCFSHKVLVLPLHSGAQEGKKPLCGVWGLGLVGGHHWLAIHGLSLFHSLNDFPTWPSGAGTLWCCDPNRRCTRRRSNCSPGTTEQRGYVGETGRTGEPEEAEERAICFYL